MQGRLGELARRYSWVGYLLVFPLAFLVAWVHAQGLIDETIQSDHAVEGVPYGPCGPETNPLFLEVFWGWFAGGSMGVFVCLGLAAIVRDARTKGRVPRASTPPRPPS